MGNARIEVFPVLVGSFASCPAVGAAHLEEVTSVPSLRVEAVALHGEKACEGKLDNILLPAGVGSGGASPGANGQ